MAESFKDYPTAENFTWNKEQEDEILTYENYGLDAKANGSTGYTKSPVTVYQEDIIWGIAILIPFGNWYCTPLDMECLTHRLRFFRKR